MFMQNRIAAAAKGAHMCAPRIDPERRRAEIDQVLAAANTALPKAALRKLGKLSFAPAIADDDKAYHAQIRSEPIGRSGLEFRCPIPATGGDGDLDGLVDKVVEAAVVTARISSKLGEWSKVVRELADGGIEPATGGIANMRVLAIGATPDLHGGELKPTIDVEMLACDLRVGVERVSERDFGGLEEKLGKLVAVHLARSKVLAQAKVQGTSGWVDDAALLIIDAAGFDREDILATMASREEVEFSFGGDEGHDVMGALYWSNGVIKGYAERRDVGKLYRLDVWSQ